MQIFYLCVKIFFARILDVSIGTFRMIITIKGKAVTASIMSFFEILIWFVAVKEALNTEESGFFIAISYSLGFATGTYIGSILSEKYIKGTLSIQIVLSKRDYSIIEKIRAEGFAVSIVDVKGQKIDENKYMLFIEIDKNRMLKFQNLIRKLDPKAFIVVNETKMVQGGFFK